MSTAYSSSDFTESPPPPLIGALLRTPYEAVVRHMLARMHERGFADFDASYMNVFRYPGPHWVRPSELAAQLGITKQALNYQLGELERLGYLERRPDPDDLRSKRVALTPRGAEAAVVIREAVAEMADEWARKLGAKRFAELRGLLVELNQHI